jgi:hypothetical protein
MDKSAGNADTSWKVSVNWDGGAAMGQYTALFFVRFSGESVKRTQVRLGKPVYGSGEIPSMPMTQITRF